MEIPNACDVLVIGGGPAGSMSASMLAMKGYHVVLIEKETFPRNTVGESIIPHFWKYMDVLGISERIREEGFIEKNGGCGIWNGNCRTTSFSHFGYDQPGLHVERDVFDNILLNRARDLGTSVHHHILAGKIESTDNTEIVHYRNLLTEEEGLIQAKFVIDATGQGALRAKQTRTRIFDPDFRFVAYWGYYTGGKYLDNKTEVQDFGMQHRISPATIQASFGNWGWVWQIVLRESTSIGIILPKKQLSHFKQLGTTIEERFVNQVDQVPILGDLMRDATLIPGSVRTIRDYAYTPQQLVIGKSFLVGDAAAFVDPINSAGVIMALYSGYLASWAIQKSLINPERSGRMARLFQDQLKKRLDLFRLIAYPTDMVTKELSEEGRKVLSSLSEAEKNLALTQMTLTSRSLNLPELLDREISSFYEDHNIDLVVAGI